MNGDMKQKARRVLRALNNMREGRWREFVMPPADRLDAAWLVHRYQQLRGSLLFSEASMQAGTEFLLMIIQGDERELKVWADTSPLAWCPQDQTHRLATQGACCSDCGTELVGVDLEEEWAEYKGSVLCKLQCGAIGMDAAAISLSTDEETVASWLAVPPASRLVIDSREALATVRRVAGIEE